MNIEELENIIEWLQDDEEMCVLWENKTSPDSTINKLAIVIQVLQSELERQENKPLTLSELKEMVGKELYFIDKYDNPNQPNWSGWVTLEELNNTELCIGRKDFHNFTLRIYYDLIRNGKEIFFYKHKPNGGE